MRAAASIMVAMLLAGCGSGEDASTDPVAPVAGVQNANPTSTVESTSVVTTTSVARAVESGVERSIADALLPEGAFPPPWDPKHRDPAVVGYETAPFQSSCPEYEVAEQFAGRSGGHVFWWSEGGNANHYVSREEYPGEGAEVVEMVADAAERCGTVTWGEGGGVVLEPLDLGDGVTGFSMATEGSDERGLVAATTNADLISVLWVPLWPGLKSGEYPNLSVEMFADIAQQTRTLLLQAGPATPDELGSPTTVPLSRGPSNAPTTTTGTVPGEAPASTPAPTRTPATTLPLDPATAALVLGPGDLDDTWRHESTEPFDVTVMGSDIPDLGGCGYEDALRRMEPSVEVMTRWRTTAASTGTEGPAAFFSQAAGTAPSAEDAEAIVRRFADHGDCDFNVLLGGTPDAESDAGVTTSGGLVDVAGIDVPVAELNLTVEWYHKETLNRNEASMVMFSHGPVISLVTVNALLDEPPTELAREIAALAFDKIAANSDG